jgi:NAD(P)-dependent dehydrogenase (short-subunit alcohol dehydrogenase family)
VAGYNDTQAGRSLGGVASFSAGDLAGFSGGSLLSAVAGSIIERGMFVAGRLEGLVAVVNGGGGGLGRATALGLAREGARVVVNDLGSLATGGGRDPERAKLVADQIVAEGGKAIADGGDISDWADAEAMIDQAIDTYGKLDILVNCAGIIRFGTPVDTSPEDFDAILNVHLRGYFNTTHFAAKHWVARKQYGRLINYASGASLISQPTLLAYSTAKSGVLGFTRSCANALVAYNVTANCIRPDAATRMHDVSGSAAQRRGPSASEKASGTIGDPAHVVPLVVFLASPEASHVSGRLFEARGNRYVLWTEPSEEKVMEKNFLDDPAGVYEGLADTLCDGLSLRNLKMPMAPFEEIGDWKNDYGVLVPKWDFNQSP